MILCFYTYAPSLHLCTNLTDFVDRKLSAIDRLSKEALDVETGYSNIIAEIDRRKADIINDPKIPYNPK